MATGSSTPETGRHATTPSTALFTDHYELTMVEATLASGLADRRSVFELFARGLPDGRRYGVVAGVGRALDAIESFRFTDVELGMLSDERIVDDRTLAWLADYRFGGTAWGYAEGEIYFPGSPVLSVEATFAEAVVLETLLLSIYNHDSAIASAASRMTWAAGSRPIIEMGSRRTHESAAVAAARSAYLAGFSASSNLEARRLYGVPSAGTSAHAFTLVHDTERDAFEAQVKALGSSTTLLIDTYDLAEAVRSAVEIAGPELGAVRIDSGDLGQLAVEVREQLDELGATETRIIVTSDLDEHSIAGLASAPVDGYGVGTSLVTGSGHPTCGFVYKLVARTDHDDAMVDVAKTSPGKHTIGGRKAAHRLLDGRGTAYAELVRPHGFEPVAPARPLLELLVHEGEMVGRESLDSARERHASAREELPLAARHLSRGEPAIPTVETEFSPLDGGR